MLAELEQRKHKVKEQEEELAELRNLAETVGVKTEKAVNKAVENTKHELENLFEHQKELADNKARATIELLGQKIETLSKTVADLKTENNRLNQALSHSSSQLTRIAERAVEKASGRSRPLSSPHTSD